jgi:hypothetical protein
MHFFLTCMCLGLFVVNPLIELILYNDTMYVLSAVPGNSSLKYDLLLCFLVSRPDALTSRSRPQAYSLSGHGDTTRGARKRRLMDRFAPHSRLPEDCDAKGGGMKSIDGSSRELNPYLNFTQEIIGRCSYSARSIAASIRSCSLWKPATIESCHLLKGKIASGTGHLTADRVRL